MIKEDIATDYRAIWSLVWPQALTLIATLMMTLVDTWVASKINPEVLASFGVLNQSVMFLSIVGQGIIGATLSLVGQARGAGKYTRSKRLGITMIFFALISGIIISAIAYLCRNEFLMFFKTPEDMMGDVITWFTVYLLAIPFQYTFLTTNAILRSIKQVKIILIVSVLSAILNTIGSIGLTFGSFGMPALGPIGIALATLATLCIVTAINIIILYRETFLRFAYMPTVRWMQTVYKRILKVASPIVGMQILWQTGYILVFALMANLPEGGRIGIAGFTVGMRIESMLFIPGMAMQFTASILISHLVGACKYQTARAVGTRLITLGVVVISLCAVVVWFYMDEIVRLFSEDMLVQQDVKNYLFYNLLSIPFVMATITGSGVFVGAGTTIHTFTAFSISMWLFRLPFAYVLGYMYGFNSEGVYMAMLISAIVQSAIILYFYRFTNWEGAKKVTA